MSTSPSHFERVAQILEHAAALEGSERTAYLASACGSDAPLRAEVESLLRAREAAGGFLGSPTGLDSPESGDPRLSEAMTSAGLDGRTLATIHESPGTLIGPYKILQLIGEGGFGSVFMAEQERPVQRKVALKIIKLGMDTRQVVARFEQERQALALMDHPNIAKVLDAGATDLGRPFFVMELVKGDPIIAYCDKNNLSIDQRLDLFAQVCNAVQHAHTKGIIHRDIKPSNVLVSTQDGRPHAKVIDFGIAKATASKLTQRTLFTEHRSLIGTPEYMSPEQAEGSLDIDTRTDVYSLGVLLYELLTGTTPFSSKELRSAALDEVQRIIREVEPPRPSTRLSANAETIASVAATRSTEPRKLGTLVRGELDWIVMKALEKDRHRRYETANSLAMDVRRYLAGEAVLAAPPSKAYRVRKFIRRNRVMVTAGSAVIATLLLGVTGTSIGLSRSRAWNQVVTNQRDTAREALASVADAARARAASLAEPEAVAVEAGQEAEPVKALADTAVRMIDSIDRLRLAEADQRQAAEVRRREAEIARSRADEIAEFLRDILRAADPGRDGAQTTLVSVLRRSDALFDARLQGQPEVELALRETIGQTYANLGLHRDALPHLQRALGLAARVDPPPADEDGQDARFDWLQRWMRPVFGSCIAIGEAERVLVIADMVADELANEMGEGDPTVKLIRMGAESMRPAIEMSKGTLQAPTGPQRPNAGSSRVERARERLDEAKQKHGESDLRTVDAMFELAAVVEDPAEADALYSDALAAEETLRDPADLVRQRHLLRHAIVRASGREPSAAIASLKEALRESERVAGAGHAETVDILRSIAAFQAEVPDPAGQLETLRAAASVAIKRLGAAHPTTLIVCLEAAPALAQAGEYAEAERLLRECAEAMAQGSGAGSPLLGAAHVGLAHVLAAQGRHEEAVALLRPAIERMNASPGFGASQSFDPRARLVQSLVALRRWDEAAKELEWFAADPSVESTLPQSIRRFGARLWVRLYEQRAGLEPGKGYEEEAARWRALAGTTRASDEER